MEPLLSPSKKGKKSTRVRFVGDSSVSSWINDTERIKVSPTKLRSKAKSGKVTKVNDVKGSKSKTNIYNNTKFTVSKVDQLQRNPRR